VQNVIDRNPPRDRFGSAAPAILVQAQQCASHHGFYDIFKKSFGRSGRKLDLAPIHLNDALAGLPQSIDTMSNRYQYIQHSATRRFLSTSI
jgi:hypothetical protein